MYSLNTIPRKPGVVKDISNGAALEMDIWSIPREKIGSFLELLPEPLGLGKITTSDGNEMIGFICQDYAIDTAEDITEFGGWRKYTQIAL